MWLKAPGQQQNGLFRPSYTSALSQLTELTAQGDNTGVLSVEEEVLGTPCLWEMEPVKQKKKGKNVKGQGWAIT